MANNLYKGFGIFGTIFGIVATGVAVYMTYQSKKVCDKVGAKVDDISSNIDVVIPESIVEAAIKKATDTQVQKQVKAAVVDIKEDIHKQAKDEVYKAIPDIRKELTASISEEVKKIDADKLKDYVAKKAADKAADKFDDILEESSKKFNKRLENMADIYSAIISNKTDGIRIKIA